MRRVKVDLSRFKIDPKRGLVIWLKPSKYHPRLLRVAAGHPRKQHCGKKYQIIKYGQLRQCIKRSHLIFYFVKKRWPKKQIDHINGNSLDDRISNLREATATQNAWNHKTRARRIPLPMGVRITSTGNFQARIRQNGKMHHLGAFATPEKAQKVYLAKRKQLFGEFA